MTIKTKLVSILLLAGVTPKEIRSVIPIHKQVLTKVRRKLGLPAFPSGRDIGSDDPERLAGIREAHASGASNSEIGLLFGISHQRVAALLFPLRTRARDAVRRAVKAGKLIRPNACQDCQTTGPVEAHHPNYHEPLSVEWLCSLCHGLRRAKEPGLNGHRRAA